MPDKDRQAEIALLQEREYKARAIPGLSETAGKREIRRAFRRASLKHHADVNGGDSNAPRRFHLACCASQLLTEGESCATLDEPDAPPAAMTNGRYRLDSPRYYWCWWREGFFGTECRR
jgi:DnaJ-class molecular chaperone